MVPQLFSCGYPLLLLARIPNLTFWLQWCRSFLAADTREQMRHHQLDEPLQWCRSFLAADTEESVQVLVFYQRVRASMVPQLFSCGYCRKARQYGTGRTMLQWCRSFLAADTI